MSDLTERPTVRAWPAEGARVGLMTCPICRAALLIDPAHDFDPYTDHMAWHEREATDE